MKFWARLYLLICLLSLASQAVAKIEGTQAYSAYERGDYEQGFRFIKADISHQPDNAELHIFAAEILSADVIALKAKEPGERAKLAQNYAQLALKLDPDNQEALLQYAISYGLVTRQSSPFTVWRKKMAEKTLEAIKAYRKLYPNDPRGLALHGAWHLGVVQRAGKSRAQSWFGADFDDGVALFEKAMEQRPDDIVIGSNYVIALASVADKFPSVTPRLEMVAGHCKGQEPANHFERDLIKIVKKVTRDMDPEALSKAGSQALGQKAK